MSEKKQESFMSVLCSDAFKAQMRYALPKHLNADRMARVVLTEFKKNPILSACSKQSVFSSILQASQLGLEPGMGLGHAYLVPYKNKKLQCHECQLIIGYRGMIDLAMRSGKVLGITACIVDELDDFILEHGLNPVLKHKPSVKKSGTMTYVYAIACLKNGYKQFEVMSSDDIMKIKSQSKASQSYPPWESSFDEMAKKTVIRRLFKYLPVSTEIQRAISLDERDDMSYHDMIDEDIDPAISIEAQRAISLDERDGVNYHDMIDQYIDHQPQYATQELLSVLEDKIIQ